VGTTAFELFDDRFTVIPPTGALPVSVTVPVEELPPSTVVGASDRPLKVGGLTVSVVVLVVTPSVAEIVTGVELATGLVVTVKVADVLPARTVTLDGTVALPLFDDRLTTRPPEGAGANSVTSPVQEVPPRTVAGETETLLRPAEVIVSVAVFVVAPSVAEIVDVVVAGVEVVVIVKLADNAPEEIMTDAGTEASPVAPRVTTTPPAPAGAYRVTVPVELFPPTTELGETDTLLRPAGLIVKVAVFVVLPKVAEIVAIF